MKLDHAFHSRNHKNKKNTHTQTYKQWEAIHVMYYDTTKAATTREQIQTHHKYTTANTYTHQQGKKKAAKKEPNCNNQASNTKK